MCLAWQPAPCTHDEVGAGRGRGTELDPHSRWRSLAVSHTRGNDVAEEHWFDTFGRILACGMPRRGVLRSASLVTAGLLLGGVSVAEAGKKKSKGTKNAGKSNKKSGKGKGKPKRKGQPTSCSAGACAEFATKADRDYCEFICRQCDESDPREFCIVEGDPFNAANVAVCCVEGATCCQGQCCSSEHGFPGNRCCPGAGCVDTGNDNRHCGRCGNACAGEQSCVDGSCVPSRICPPRTNPCGGGSVWTPDDCCDIAACFGCEAGPDPSNPGTSQAQCVYQCVGDHVCDAGVCCLPAGSSCNPANVGRGFCCSGQCQRDETTGGNRCL
jgi:hypothetical protein